MNSNEKDVVYFSVGVHYLDPKIYKLMLDKVFRFLAQNFRGTILWRFQHYGVDVDKCGSRKPSEKLPFKKSKKLNHRYGAGKGIGILRICGTSFRVCMYVCMYVHVCVSVFGVMCMCIKVMHPTHTHSTDEFNEIAEKTAIEHNLSNIVFLKVAHMTSLRCDRLDSFHFCSPAVYNDWLRLMFRELEQREERSKAAP